MRNSIPHNPDSVLCIKFYLKMLLLDLNFMISILGFHLLLDYENPPYL